VYPNSQLPPPPKQRGTPAVSTRQDISIPPTLFPSQQLVSLLTTRQSPLGSFAQPP
jgi:hypothetical protein